MAGGRGKQFFLINTEFFYDSSALPASFIISSYEIIGKRGYFFSYAINMEIMQNCWRDMFYETHILLCLS